MDHFILDVASGAIALAATIYGLYQRSHRQKATRSALKAAHGIRQVRQAVARNLEQASTIDADKIRVLVDAAAKLPIPNFKKRLFVISEYAKDQPRASFRAISDAVETAIAERKAKAGKAE